MVSKFSSLIELMETLDTVDNNQVFVFETPYKKLGLKLINQPAVDDIKTSIYKAYIKVLYLPPGYTVTVDFRQYVTQAPSLFFVNSNQYLSIKSIGNEDGYMIYYNRDFYCVQIHDTEVACDGLLFNNLSNMPMTTLDSDGAVIVNHIFKLIKDELNIVQAQQGRNVAGLPETIDYFFNTAVEYTAIRQAV